MLKGFIGSLLLFFGLPLIVASIEGEYLYAGVTLVLVLIGLWMMYSDKNMPTDKDFLEELRSNYPTLEINFKKKKTIKQAIGDGK